ncbi:SEC-C metal-binding domain-containing protein [Nakamurella sp. PAMC28650]|uniref:SEC-C metal-binding domain-containing protein n=1 Tax=Nakamurella sp. PAMC28650 TaxID=2762325 RepID=UPI00164D11FB|nr:SEC-C metal-binding domain-containing protein [Nakamurella sp. PAMC28650]QNK81443.1 SEC-C domain-containing protein [Nakamurella sp. PAMC28650]
MTDKTIHTIVDIMRDRASMPLPALLSELRRRHLPLTRDEFDVTWEDEGLQLLARVELTDPEVLINLPLALAGRTFTHRLTDEEVERDLLVTAPDFTAIWPLLDLSPYDRLDGRTIGDDFDEESLQAVIRLPEGTLAGHQAGSMVCISVAADGLHLAPAPEPEPHESARLVSVLVEDYLEVFGGDLVRADQEDIEDEAELLADTPEARGPVALEEFMAMVIARHDQIFTAPGPPITDVLEQLGLDHDHGAIAVAGFDFAAEDEARSEAEELEMLIETYDLDRPQAEVVLAFAAKIDELHDAVHDWTDDGNDEDALPDLGIDDLVPLLPVLSDPMVVVAIAEETLAGDPHLGVILTMMLGALDEQVPRRALAGFIWLQGRCADVLGDVLVAEAAYTRALDLDSDHFPAMRELARIASLRGDAGRAVSLLLRAGVSPQDPELAIISPFAGEQRRDVGRNDDCWCGSGRKYKKCHLGKSDHSLASRWEWLYHKASHWVRSGRGRDLLVELAATRAHPDTDPAALIAAVNDPLVMDVTLFEGGLLAEFLDERGGLLPSDELELATTWLRSTRGLFQVENVSRATGLRVKNVVTGDTAEVPSPPGKVKVGGLVCLRLLPTGSSWVVGGGVQTVSPGAREMVLAMLDLQDDDDVDPERVVSVLSAQPVNAAS